MAAYRLTVVIDGHVAVAAAADKAVAAEQHRLRGTVTFPEHASEAVGNDDGLREAGEDCRLDRNVGAYPGNDGAGEADEEIGLDLLPRHRRDPPAVWDVHLGARDETTVGPVPCRRAGGPVAGASDREAPGGPGRV